MAALDMPLHCYKRDASSNVQAAAAMAKECCLARAHLTTVMIAMTKSNTRISLPTSTCTSASASASASTFFILSTPLRTSRSSRRAPRCLSVDVDSESPAEAPTEAPPEVPVDSRRAAEKFVVLNTGKWECRSCGYVYDQFAGDSSYPIAAGTEFDKLPEDWRCPTCGAARSYFSSKSIEVAGFAENQKFGLGTNSLTSGQKSLLIYGSLLLFFLLFLSGYFLQ